MYAVKTGIVRVVLLRRIKLLEEAGEKALAEDLASAMEEILRHEEFVPSQEVLKNV